MYGISTVKVDNMKVTSADYVVGSGLVKAPQSVFLSFDVDMGHSWSREIPELRGSILPRR